MFDIGFLELIVIGVVALLVVGPERLPRVARTAGLWLGRGRRMLSSVKAEELKQILAKQARSNPLETIIEGPETTPSPTRPETEATGSKQDSTPG